MERTEAFEILASSGQTDVLADDLHDVSPVPDLIDHVFCDQTSAHGRRSSSLPPEKTGRDDTRK